MAAVTDYADWKTLCLPERHNGSSFAGFSSYTGDAGINPLSDFFMFGGATPSTSVTVDNTSAGALLQQPRLPGTSTKQLWTAETEFAFSCNQFGQGSTLMLVDRLVQHGGLSATVITEQTTNLPTAALSRYTSGAGVLLCLEIYGQVGGTTTTVTCNYTNQAGTAGRTTQAVSFGGAGGTNSPSVLRIMPLQDSDTGVRSVEGVTLAATTGTAGDFGVTLVKPLCFFPVDTGQNTDKTAWRNMLFGGGVVEVLPNACLQTFQLASLATFNTVNLIGHISLAAK